MKKNPLIALTFFSLLSCAHQAPQATLPGEWKVDRTQLTTGMPNYPLSPELMSLLVTSAPSSSDRAPASDEELAADLAAREQRPSLRRLYFRALYQQWRELTQAHGGSLPLKSCPQFHHDRTVLDEAGVSTLSHVIAQKPSGDQLAFYPEWTLNVKTTEGVAPVWLAGQVTLVNRALKGHAGKLKKELTVLCEEGASDAYFRLENMVTYLTDRPTFQSAEGLKALLKIPVFSTMLLLKALDGAQVAQFSAHEQALLHEVKAFQLQRYIVELKNRRQQRITGSL